MKARLAAVVLIAAASGANADEYQDVHRAAPTALDAAAKPCDALAAMGDSPTSENPACKKVTSKTVTGVGTVVLYSLGAVKDGFIRYAMVIDGKQVSPPIELMSDCEMAGDCDNLVKATPKLRAVKINDQPAVALDVTTKFSLDSVDGNTGTPTGSTPWKRYDYVVCGTSKSGALGCLTAGFGSASGNCHASLSKDGLLTHACDESTWMDLK